ncbi:ATP-dependent DNA helicase [Flavobacteriaceae bacterium]|nr:ATP-dependent DNA helicase [Flavobacteriaceae bacterium]MDC1492971.1 ATP-dependent DNA helicase [Flavobacteriaceae bacterium]
MAYNLHAELKKYFGFDQFKGLQESVIKSLLDKKDTFVIMPTGGGKSLCYQLPALINAGTAIVVSPLIALMKNQVDSLRFISNETSVAHVLNSSLNKSEIDKVKMDISMGKTKLLYMAPESLSKETNIEFLKKQNISFMAVDEAHCISEWGHDFRPDYRNLRNILDKLDKEIPIIGLTATATEKVQEDIIKNLKISGANIFKASFNRPNLYYEVRTKDDYVEKDIIKYIKNNIGKSGIIYCLSRKKVEEIASVLQVNEINALPYHAGLDSKTRANHQDMFLMEDVDIIVATIAFGMGIDKPDVRFVIHHDIPKSIESYYQETGRAGRDGGEGHCIAYYAYKDIEKLEKFMSGKPVAEQEIGHALLQEMVSYAETSISRRKFILHYFGEEFDNKTGKGGMLDDNMKNPKPKSEAKSDVLNIIKIINQTKEIYKSKDLADILVGKENALIKSHSIINSPLFAIGNDKPYEYWMALIRQCIVTLLLRKDIETYGIVKITEKGLIFLNKPISFMMTKDHHHKDQPTKNNSNKNLNISRDDILLKMLKNLRKDIAHKLNIPPFVIFQDPSLNDMTLKYPTSISEMSTIHGVGEGKSKKYGPDFIELISKYVNENNIIIEEDVVVKSTGTNSALKLYIIQSIDRKLPLEDIASAKSLDMIDFIKEMEVIVYSGTKLNIKYWIDYLFDEDQQAELDEYFIESESDDLTLAIEEFDDEYEEEDLRLFRIKFLSEVAN